MKNRKTTLLTAAIVIMTMCIAFCGCTKQTGQQTEKTEPTTVSQEQSRTQEKNMTQKTSTTQKTSETQETTTAQRTEATAEESTAKADYKAIYKEYNTKMKAATAEYVEALKKEASSTSDKNDFYDKTQGKLEDLKKIKEEGAKAMIDAMLKSTRDDAESYEKWFAKLTSAYSDYSREITSVYTDSF